MDAEKKDQELLDRSIHLEEESKMAIPDKAKKAVVFDKDGKEVGLYSFY
jgi:hypothetical protein